MKILVPTDFSEHSRAALSEAVAWAEQGRGTILLVHVAGISHWPVTEIWSGSEPDHVIVNDLRKDSEERLRTIQSAEIGSRVASEAHVLDGAPHVEIVRFAEDQGVDLVVIATHGHSRLKRFFLGSTTERIVRSAPCPVLVVRDRTSAPNGHHKGIAGLKKILVATDFSEHSAGALQRAIVLAKEGSAQILLLHVFRDADYPTRQVLSRGLWDEVRWNCQRRLRELQEDRIPEGVPSNVLLKNGVPSAEIADAAADNEVDLVVIGSRGHTGAKRFFLGSTAERVVRVAPCSVFVEKVRQEQPA